MRSLGHGCCCCFALLAVANPDLFLLASCVLHAELEWLPCIAGQLTTHLCPEFFSSVFGELLRFVDSVIVTIPCIVTADGMGFCGTLTQLTQGGLPQHWVRPGGEAIPSFRRHFHGRWLFRAEQLPFCGLDTKDAVILRYKLIRVKCTVGGSHRVTVSAVDAFDVAQTSS